MAIKYRVMGEGGNGGYGSYDYLESAQRRLDDCKSLGVKCYIEEHTYESPAEKITRLESELERYKQAEKERNNGCEYCKTVEHKNNAHRVFYKELPHDTRFITSLDNAHLQIAFDLASGWVLHYEDDDGFRMFDIKITHCPNCGRKLGEHNEIN